MTTIAVAIVGRAITLRKAIENSSILLSQYWKKETISMGTKKYFEIPNTTLISPLLSLKPLGKNSEANLHLK